MRWMLAICVALFSTAGAVAQSNGVVIPNLRAPAVPLVACDPYFSVWSPGNKLTDVETTHWTGKRQRITCLVKLDGKTYRVIGASPKDIPALPQLETTVLPTRTICRFAMPELALDVTFTTPALPESIDLLSWPVTYVTFAAKSLDGKKHQVEIGFEVDGEICVDNQNQKFVWTKPEIAGLSTAAVGSESQNILSRSGDDLRIDWGYCYLSAPLEQKPTWAGNQLQLSLGEVDEAGSSRWLMLAYDDLFSIQYMGRNLRPYWRRNGWEAADLLKAAAQQYGDLSQRCAKFDAELVADMKQLGGDNYAALCALSYRQCFAAGKFVADKNGQPMQFSKENHSNGCVATSDVFYPMAPQFLLLGPSLAKSFLVPFMNYAASERWKFPFAPHDLGQYPLANGQVYGGGERTEDNQMPVEESGNMLLLFAAVAQMEGNPSFANLYWKQLTKWADYLIEKGFDPENQLCTDDFAGHLAHNVNLSMKAICAIGAYAKLCEMRGDTEQARKAYAKAKEFADRWVKEADDGDHYRLAFDRKGSWSQKYNLIWDRILDLKLFPESVAQKELAYYRKIQNEYGLPLDNRETYTKLDWILWTATLTQNREDFDALLNPVMAFINETPDRSPLTDWYQTKSGKKVGFTARPVIGGVFVQALYNKPIWQKYASRDITKAANWAPIPKAPKVTEIIPTANAAQVDWHYSFSKPGDNWVSPEFAPQANGWKTGKAGFGTAMTPSSKIGTEWNTSDIWLLRDFELADDLSDLRWHIHHDEDVEIYVNGKLAERRRGYTVSYDLRAFSAETKKLLKPGKNRIAIHCHQTSGGQYIDLGIARVIQID